MTIKELAQNWIENDRTGDYYNREITIEEASDFVSMIDPEVVEETNATPEAFMEAWNSIVRG